MIIDHGPTTELKVFWILMPSVGDLRPWSNDGYLTTHDSANRKKYGKHQISNCLENMPPPPPPGAPAPGGRSRRQRHGYGLKCFEHRPFFSSIFGEHAHPYFPKTALLCFQTTIIHKGTQVTKLRVSAYMRQRHHQIKKTKKKKKNQLRHCGPPSIGDQFGQLHHATLRQRHRQVKREHTRDLWHYLM